MNLGTDPHEDGPATAPPQRRAMRRAGTRFAAAALVALALIGSAVASAQHDTAPTAQDTVRGFLVDAVVEQNTVDACEYLTRHAAVEVAAAEPRDTPCEQALMGAALTLGHDTIGSEAAVKRLRYHAVENGGRARVTVQEDGATRTFALRKVAGRSFAGPGPEGPWRIDGGVAALLAARAGV